MDQDQEQQAFDAEMQRRLAFMVGQLALDKLAAETARDFNAGKAKALEAKLATVGGGQ